MPFWSKKLISFDCQLKDCSYILWWFFLYSRNSTRPILIPLPYIRSDISMTTLGKQQKPAYNAPYIYNNRTNKPTTRLAHPVNNASPAVINFSPMNIPDISRPGTKNGMFVGSKSSALNKSNGTSGVPDVSMQSAIPVPFLSSPGPFKGSTPNQTPALFDGRSKFLAFRFIPVWKACHRRGGVGIDWHSPLPLHNFKSINAGIMTFVQCMRHANTLPLRFVK